MDIRKIAQKEWDIPENTDLFMNLSKDGSMILEAKDLNSGLKLTINQNPGSNFNVIEDKDTNHIIINVSNLHSLSEEELITVLEKLSAFPFLQENITPSSDGEDVMFEDAIFEFNQNRTHKESKSTVEIFKYKDNISDEIISNVYSTRQIFTQEGNVNKVQIIGENFPYKLEIIDNGTTAIVIENDLIIFEGSTKDLDEYLLSDVSGYVDERLMKMIDLLEEEIHLTDPIEDFAIVDFTGESDNFEIDF